MTFFRSQTVIECSKDHVMSYLASVTNYHSAMILKMTAGIDEHPFADGDIFTEIGIERWKYPERFRYLVTE